MGRLACILMLCVAAARPGVAAFAPVTREAAERGGAVCVTGVVTCVAHWQTNSFVLAAVDDPDGHAFYVSGQHTDGPTVPLPTGSLAVGDVLEVRGRLAPMFFAPGISADSFAWLGRAALPPAPHRAMSDFAYGRLDNRRAAFAGVVRAVGRGVLRLGTRAGPLEVRVAGAERLADLIDAEVEVSGVVMSRYNPRAEFLGIYLEAAGPDACRVLRPAPADPFAAREVPLDAILAWRPDGPDGHRVKVRGTVTASFPDGAFYLQSGDGAVRATAAPPPPVGAQVEAAGFPEMADGIGQLTDAVWREAGGSGVSPLAPVELTAADVTNLAYRADLTYIDYDCRLVALTGRLCRLEPSDGSGASLLLDVAGAHVRVDVAGEPPALDAEERPLLRVVGIARLDASGAEAGGRRPGLAAVRLEARGAADVTLVPDAAWRAHRRARTLRRVLNALAALPLLFLAAGAWLWRRARIRRRDRALLAAERRRMADDLHDTIEQHLAGARILLTTARGALAGGCGVPPLERKQSGGTPLPPADAAVAKALEMAETVLGHAKREVRDVILNLRNERLMAKPPRKLLEDVAARLNRAGTVRVTTRLDALPPRLPAGVKADLLAIVQQAITNAVHHGHAQRVALVATDPATLRILNDGEAFDAAKALGPEAGHFGLANMRERARRSGFAIDWRREGDWMAVRLELKAKKGANE